MKCNQARIFFSPVVGVKCGPGTKGLECTPGIISLSGGIGGGSSVWMGGLWRVRSVLGFRVLVGSHRKLCTELIGGALALAGSTNKCRASSLASNIETLDAVIEPYLMTLTFLMKQVTGNKFLQSLLCM